MPAFAVLSREEIAALTASRPRRPRAAPPAPLAPLAVLPAPRRRQTGGWNAGRTYWTEQRVREGLRRYYDDTGQTPCSTEEWQARTRGSGRMRERRYPSFTAVLRYWPTFRAAWRALGVSLACGYERWTPLEDWYLREAVGLISRRAIGRDLGRTEGAVKRRMYDLGLSARQARWGWPANRVQRVCGITPHQLNTLARLGWLRLVEGNVCRYVDPADLALCLAPHVALPDELQAAARPGLLARIAGAVSALAAARGQ